MEKQKTVKINPTDLYQFLIEGNRYGYTRNNHLMPGGAFDHCRKYLPLLYKTDMAIGVRTAQQLAEEAIEQLFQDSFREDQRKFHVEIRHPNWTQCPELEFSPSLDFHCFGSMSIYDTTELWATPDGKATLLLSFERNGDGKLVPHRGHDSYQSLYVTLFEPDEIDGVYYSIPDYRAQFDPGDTVRFMVGRHHEPGMVNVADYIGFIEYCLNFLSDHGFPEKKPYNIDLYEKYKSSHGIK